MIATILGLVLLAVVAGGAIWTLAQPDIWRCPTCGRYHGRGQTVGIGLVGTRRCPDCGQYN
jgi:rubredoxin